MGLLVVEQFDESAARARLRAKCLIINPGFGVVLEYFRYGQSDIHVSWSESSIVKESMADTICSAIASGPVLRGWEPPGHQRSVARMAWAR